MSSGGGFVATPFVGDPYQSPLYQQTDKEKNDCECMERLLSRLEIYHNGIQAFHQKILDSLVQTLTNLEERRNDLAAKIVNPMSEEMGRYEERFGNCCCKVVESLTTQFTPLLTRVLELEGKYGKPIEEPTEEATPSEPETEGPGEVAPFAADRKPQQEPELLPPPKEIPDEPIDAEPWLGPALLQAIRNEPQRVLDRLDMIAQEAGFMRPPGKPPADRNKPAKDCCDVNIQIALSSAYIEERKNFYSTQWGIPRDTIKDTPIMDHVRAILLAVIPNVMPHPLLIESEALAEYGAEDTLIEEEAI